MVIIILSAKEMDITSVFTPFIGPATCFVRAGKGAEMISDVIGSLDIEVEAGMTAVEIVGELGIPARVGPWM